METNTPLRALGAHSQATTHMPLPPTVAVRVVCHAT